MATEFQLKQHTAEAIETLRKAEWFAALGRQDRQGVVTVSSWLEAVAHCASPKWQEVHSNGHYFFAHEVQKTSPERYAQWNAVKEWLRPIGYDLAIEKAKPIVERDDLPEVVLECAKTDMFCLLVEAEFQDVVPKGGLYRGLSFYYSRGHFPCGWDGEFPKGKLIIF